MSKDSELVQTHISKDADKMLRQRVEKAALSKSAWLRRLIYRELGLLKEEGN
jgi:hypothetical protein